MQKTSSFAGALLALQFLAACADPSASTPATAKAEASTARAAEPARASETAASADAVVRRVASDEVCMMNNRFMKEKQIPVEVEGRTYFGCCAMCKDKLTNDATARSGTDPISGRPVDKATALIGAKPNNAVVYFESQETFDAYVTAGGKTTPPATTSSSTPASASASASASPQASPAPRAPAAPVSPQAPAAPTAKAAPIPPTPTPASPTPPAPAGDHTQHGGH